MRRLPQPIPYQGSKRGIAQQILTIFPGQVDTLIEPFAGSAALSVAAAYHKKAARFFLNDLNKPLIDLLGILIQQPHQIADDYERLWKAQLGQEREYYDFIRAEFNKTHRPDYLLYLLARCVKASVRYNANGEFNQSPDNRRKGRLPESMRREIFEFSRLLNGRTVVKSGDYKEVLDMVSPSNLIYLDPPYQGTSQNKDPRYYSGICTGELSDFLRELNKRQVRFILSYDGRTGEKSYGVELPASLNLHQFELHAGRSSQSTLLGGTAETYESLYLSSALVHQLYLHQDDISELFGPVQSRRGTFAKQLELGIA
jgi:DNA adenine methylase